VKCGENIIAHIEASNVAETIVELNAPDTVLISQSHRAVLGKGTFKKELVWSVEHVQKGFSGMVEINASAGSLFQTGLCRITG